MATETTVRAPSGAQAPAERPPDTVLWRFARRLPAPLITLPGLVCVMALALFWLTGAMRLGDPDSPYPVEREQWVGLSVMFALLLAYFSFFSLISSRYGGHVFYLFKHRTVPGADIADFQRRYSESPHAAFWAVAVAVGSSIGIAQSYSLFVFAGEHPVHGIWALTVGLANMAVWAFSFLAAT